MKKLLLIMVAIFGFLSCENPSVEDGLANLETALADTSPSHHSVLLLIHLNALFFLCKEIDIVGI